MPRAVTLPSGGVVPDRIARFDAYRETLDDQGRKELDAMIEHVSTSMRERGCRQFGVAMSKELIMALLDNNLTRPTV